MSGIGAISGFSAMSFQMSSRMMQDAAAVDEGDDEGEFMVEARDTVEIEMDSEDEDGAGETDDVEEGSALGGQVDAWG